MPKLAMAAVAALALMLAPFGAQGDPAEDNEENCLRTGESYIIIFSGTDAGATRRGFNAGTTGCSTATDPDLPYVDTNYLTPGATHVIVSITGVPESTDPGPAQLVFGELTVPIEWHWATDPLTDRWESQSIEMPDGTGTMTATVDNYGSVHYQKLV